jgi:hypothetical protein
MREERGGSEWCRGTKPSRRLYGLLHDVRASVERHVPGFAWVIDAWNGAWALVVPWTARHLFGVERAFAYSRAPSKAGRFEST